MRVLLQPAGQVDLLTLQEDRVVGRSSREREGAVCAPAFWMLTMRPVGGGGDDVSNTPALPVDHGDVVPNGLHLLVQIPVASQGLQQGQKTTEHIVCSDT